MIKCQKVLHLSAALAKKTCKISGEYILTVKDDGWFVHADYNARSGLWTGLMSSADRTIPSMKHINLGQMIPTPKESCKLIFEATIPGLDFYTANGIFNRKKELALNTVLHLHDVVSLERRRIAAERFKLVQDVPENDILRHTRYLGISSDINEWYRHFYEQIEKGEEGICMKRASAGYTWKENSGAKNEDLMKLKGEVTLDLLCIDIVHSVGNKGEPAMNLVLKRKSGTEVQVVVPRDNDRIKWTANPEQILGHIVEVNAMSENEPGGTLRQPVFKAVRHDKTANEID